jgi:DHA3 family macrolide efflux protein-like MFS transporter
LSEAVGEGPERRPGKLWNRDFLLLWQGQAVSQIGSQATLVATSFWLLERTGSASLMGLLTMAGMLPVVLLGPIGGSVADRASRKKIIVWTDAASGLAMLALGLVMILDRAPTPLLVGLLFGVSIATGILRAFFAPAIQASIPDLVPRDRLTGANSLNQITIQGSLILGQGAGGLLFQWIGAPLLILIDGLSFLLSALCSAAVRLPPPRPRADGPAQGAFRRLGADLLEGLAYVRGRRGLLPFLLAASSFNFFVMPIVVLLPIFVRETLGAEPKWYGFLLAASSAGSIAGYLGGGALRLDGKARGRFVLAMMGLAPIPFLMMAFSSSRLYALALAALVGIFVAGINVYVVTALQATTPPAMRGRVLGLLGTLAGGLMPLGAMLGGIVGDLTHHDIPHIYVGSGLASLAFTLVLAMRPSVFGFLSYREEELPRPAAPAAGATGATGATAAG